MVCVACSKTPKQNDSNDCFEIALDNIKQHYNFYKNSIRRRDLELLQLKERNEELLKALELLQKSQQPAKRFKTNEEGSWLSPSNNNHNTSKDEAMTDISLTDDDEVAAGVSNLNMALNSEQLFETSILSPAANASNSEMIISPRSRESPRRNKQRDQLRSLHGRNKLLEKSKSEWHIKERSGSSDTSWASKFIKPAANVKATEDKVNNETKKPEKKLNLSLKKINPSKMKQSLLQFNNPKDLSLLESEICDDIIGASPVVHKNSRAGRSWAQRSGINHSTALNNTNPASEETRQNPEETISIPIENIVFDFSPSKQTDNPAISDSPATKLSCKQLTFDKVVNESNIDCTVLPADHSPNRSESSSVVILTPATQDVIFVDDTCNEISHIDTMDLLADIMKHDTENLKNLKRYESKNIEKQQKLKDTKQKTPKEDKMNFIKPVASIKRETNAQYIVENPHRKGANEAKDTPSSFPENRQKNPLLDEGEDEEEEEDTMPIPYRIKEEPDKPKTSKKLTIMERFNINCDDCEKYINFFGDRLSDSELAKHINQCTRHKQPDDLRHNTPEDFWNPFILSFPENDPRNEMALEVPVGAVPVLQSMIDVRAFFDDLKRELATKSVIPQNRWKHKIQLVILVLWKQMTDPNLLLGIVFFIALLSCSGRITRFNTK